MTEEQVTDLINAETRMTAEEAKEIFDVQIEERPAGSPPVLAGGWRISKKHRKALKHKRDDVTARITAEKKQSIEKWNFSKLRRKTEWKQRSKGC